MNQSRADSEVRVGVTREVAVQTGLAAVVMGRIVTEIGFPAIDLAVMFDIAWQKGSHP